MRYTAFLAIFIACQALAHITSNLNLESDEATLWRQAQFNYEKFTDNFLANDSSGDTACSEETVRLRPLWDNLGDEARLEYIRAVKCLYSLPSTTDPSLAPGAKRRIDDFVYTHINQTNFVHGSGIFLPWHRQFMSNFEDALFNECAFTGTGVPYWDWFRHADNQAKAPVFDASPVGFGGNGKYVLHQADNFTLPDVPGPVYLNRPAGTGGGCITDGAFADILVNLGPVAPAETPEDDPYGIKGNPHCLIRDFLQSKSSEFLTYKKAADLLATTTYDEFRSAIDQGEMHPSSHAFLGGDGYDFYSSPNDPVFFLLHSQIDRIWSIWQAQDYDTRTYQVGGTVTFRNLPPSENATLDTVLKMMTTGEDVSFRDTVSPIENYCYKYT